MMEQLVRVVRRELPRIFSKKLPRVIKVATVSEKEATRLNFVYRKKNKPANVLSFRYGPEYGEIIICPALIRREAWKQGNSYRYQLTWMILHGILHLAGLHHERSSAAARAVAKLEQAALRKLFP